MAYFTRAAKEEKEGGHVWWTERVLTNVAATVVIHYKLVGAVDVADRPPKTIIVLRS